MYLAYSLLLTLGLLVLIPHFFIQAFVHGKYMEGLGQRFGSLKKINSLSRPVIWLHCVSVGETQAARPLVERLRSEFPQYSLVVSTITITGQTLARSVFGSQAEVIYFPFDWTWTVRRALRAITPDIVLIMETELWPNFLRECDSQRIPVALVNGRISTQSFRRYRIVRFFLQPVLSHLTLAVMQSEQDAKRIAALGMSNERLFTVGNLKFDAPSVSPKAEATELLQTRFQIRDNTPLVLAASTHAPEEKILIEAFQTLRQKRNLRLMIAPRKPERFQEVANLLNASGLSWVKRTNEAQPTDGTTEVILLDTIGELPAAYSLASIVFVGGSIVSRGGHNVLEPAVTGTCVVTGHNTQNFQTIVDLMSEADAIVQFPPLDPRKAAQCVIHTFEELLLDDRRRSLLGARAKEIVEANQGATDRTIALLRPLFEHSHQKTPTHQTISAASSPTS